MRDDLKTICEQVPNGRSMARFMFVRERVIERVMGAGLDPDDIDLNPHLQIQHVADQVIGDVQSDFPEVTREEVYLMWLTMKVFRGAASSGFRATKPDPLVWTADKTQ